MPYNPFRNTYDKAQQPPNKEVSREYLDQELRKLEKAIKELTDQVKVLQSLVPNP